MVNAHVSLLQARAISPPKCPANINSEDVSRIDTGRCGGSNFLVHVFKDAQRTRLLLFLFFSFENLFPFVRPCGQNGMLDMYLAPTDIVVPFCRF